MAQLKVIKGNNEGQCYWLEDQALLGRSLNNSVCLLDSCASRQHAKIIKSENSYFIEDLNSANGTYHNNNKIEAGTSAKLTEGDILTICSTTLVFSDTDISQSENSTTKSNSAQTKNLGNILVTVNPGKSDNIEPAVAVAIDASVSMVDVPKEKQSGKGLHKSIKRLQAMCQVSISLGAILNQEALMQKIIDCIFDIFPHAERSFIMLHNPESGKLEPVAAKSRVKATDAEQEIAISQTIISEVISNKRSILSNDAQSDDRFSKQMSIVNLSIRSIMCAPLLVADEILGLIQIDTCSGVHNFGEDDLQLLTGISSQAAIAVKNSQLYQAVETETARRTSLQRYFSPNMVEMLMSGDIDTELGGKSYLGTVFFSDIIGFTKMSENMSPGRVVANLNRYFNIMQRLIYSNGGNVDKFGGDAIMAFWSVPQHKTGDEEKAILTGVEMQSQLWSYNLALVVEGQKQIYMGIGINTGDFVAGNIGSEDKIEFTLIGDNVNLAARIEACAGRSQVFVSEDTWKAAKDKVAAVQLPPLIVKGKSLPITIYSIRSVCREAENKQALSALCEIFEEDGNLAGPGILTALKIAGNDSRMTLNSSPRLDTGTTITLKLNLLEYHQELEFSAVVAEVSLISSEDGIPYTHAVLHKINNAEIIQFFTPGSCRVTTKAWENIKRE